VVAFNCGSVPEIIENGLTGFVVEDEASATRAVGRIHELSRPEVRKRFEQRFTARRMAEDYLAVYRQIAGIAKPELRLVG
jgi:glycosyltransferase involved in cell wall biosynthesis